ncbi:MAG: prolyl oligopeptidase family serine peptidase [Microbacteriaceae bacterium]|nr:prolyl oligopeptidase family serine peptidase [Microbacteriaceae bacterium]
MSIPAISDDATQWSVAGKQAGREQALQALAAGQPLLVLMHGLGSHERDLFGLVPHLPQQFVCASLRAPLPAYTGSDGFAWFPLSLQPGGVLPEQASGHAKAAAERVLEWLDGLRSDVASHGGGLGQVAIMGFSQGGVMVTTLLRLRSEAFAAGVNCSGFVAPGEFLGDADLREKQPPLFWGRDDDEEVISQAAMRACAQWSPLHTNLTERNYPGIGHSISLAELKDISEFLNTHVAG